MPKKAAPAPSGWPSIKTTYETQVRGKFLSQQDPGAQLSAINYFMDRLQQDKTAILNGDPLPE